MSFMFNPHPYEDQSAVNRPELNAETINSIISGTKESVSYIAELILEETKKNENAVIIALEGYIGAEFIDTINLLSQNQKLGSLNIEFVEFKNIFKSSQQLDDEIRENYLEEDREKDPVLLFGKLCKEGFEMLADEKKLSELQDHLKAFKTNNPKNICIVYGCGCTMKALRTNYDLVFYYDVTPKEVMLRARKGRFANLGDKIAKPIRAMLRRCYYIDFELAGHLRWELIKENAIDYYIISNDPDNLKLISNSAFQNITSSLARYPLRCKPVYLEGVWGGYYFKKLRNLPDNMVNCAWVFDLIPLEVSIVVEAGHNLLEFPYFTFVQQEGEALMGKECVEKFGGYFPIRFNYDDSYHSNGNMSIQVHSGHEYNVKNYNEHGRQDESYYVVATGHDAKTYIGFNEDVDVDEFISEVKKSEKEFTPVDYQKYVNHIVSKPGVQVMLPAGTIHSSGRNQVVLEIGSLSIGSYTYKMYDYLREDLDRKPRPIHTFHGEKVLSKERTTTWVNNNLAREPQLVESGENWAEYIVGEHDMLYFSLRRLEFEQSIKGDTKGKFHVLTLVDGEQVIIQSVSNPEIQFTQNFLDVVVVPANLGKYIIKNLGDQPVCVHKTMLKDDFTDDSISNN